MRYTGLALAGIILAVFLVGYFERRPELKDFDPAIHGKYRDTWNKRVHLSYWEKWGGFEGEAAATMVDEFNDSQDEIFVHYIQTSQVDRKAMLASIGDNPPDIIGFWENNVPAFAEGGALMELDELMKQSGLGPEHYIPQYLDLCRYQGKIYALPSSPATLALFYNKELFRKKAGQLRQAGLDPERPPLTIEELDRYADVLNEFDNKGNPVVMGFLPTEPGWWNYSWGRYFGGELYDRATGKLTPDTEPNVAALVWVKRYAEKYGREKLLRFRQGFGTYDSPYNAFIDGRVAMEIQGVWFPNFIRRHRPHLEFGVAPFPTPQGVPGPRSLMEADTLALPRSCRHPKEAWKFLEFTQKTGLATMCRLQGKHMPIAHPPANFHEGHPNLELKVFEDLARSPYSFINPRVIVWQEYRDQLSRVFEHVWNWPVPESDLAGLTGAERQRKVDQICEQEIRQSLAEVRERMQGKLDKQRELSRRRGETP